MTARRLRARPQTSTVRILGVDASLNSTGYAFDDLWGVPETDHITPGGKKGSTRLWHNLVQFRRLLDNVKPGVIILEGYAMNAKGNRTFQIGEWGGIIRLEAWQRGITVITVTPSTLKYVATGKGNAGKPEMMKACQTLFGLTIRQDDEADAFLLQNMGKALLEHTGPKVFVDRVLEKQREPKPGIAVEKGMPR